MQINRPTVSEVLPLARAYYAKAGNEVGGNLHIVLEDGNVRDSHVHACLAHAEAKGDVDGVELATKLLQMTTTQRLKVAAQL